MEKISELFSRPEEIIYYRYLTSCQPASNMIPNSLTMVSYDFFPRAICDLHAIEVFGLLSISFPLSLGIPFILKESIFLHWNSQWLVSDSASAGWMSLFCSVMFAGVVSCFRYICRPYSRCCLKPVFYHLENFKFIEENTQDIPKARGGTLWTGERGRIPRHLEEDKDIWVVTRTWSR